MLTSILKRKELSVESKLEKKDLCKRLQGRQYSRMRIAFLFLSFLTLVSTNIFPADSFIVQLSDNTKKGRRLSKNDAKEEIAYELKEILSSSSKLLVGFARIQKKMGKIYMRVVPKLEELINDEKNFRKASKEELLRTLGIASAVSAALKSYASAITELEKRMDTDDRLRSEKTKK